MGDEVQHLGPSSAKVEFPMVTLTRKAKIAFDTLGVEDKTRIERALEVIERFPKGGIPPHYVHKLSLPGKIYVARAGLEWRIIFELSDDTKQILDIVRYDRLERFHQALSTGGGS